MWKAALLQTVRMWRLVSPRARACGLVSDRAARLFAEVTGAAPPCSTAPYETLRGSRGPDLSYSLRLVR